jgi:hypothetical protein
MMTSSIPEPTLMAPVLARPPDYVVRAFSLPSGSGTGAKNDFESGHALRLEGVHVVRAVVYEVAHSPSSWSSGSRPCGADPGPALVGEILSVLRRLRRGLGPAEAARLAGELRPGAATSGPDPGDGG